MSEYRVKSVITEYPSGKAEALFEISEGFFVPLDVFMEMKKKSGEELKKAIEQAKALEKKGKIKRFLKMAAAKVKEKQAKKKAEAKPKSEPRAVLGERKIVLPPASLKDEDLVDEATMLSYGFSKGEANPGNPDEVIRFYHHIDTDDYYYRDSDDNAVGYIGKRPEFLALSIKKMKEAKAKKLAREAAAPKVEEPKKKTASEKPKKSREERVAEILKLSEDLKGKAKEGKKSFGRFLDRYEDEIKFDRVVYAFDEKNKKPYEDSAKGSFDITKQFPKEVWNAIKPVLEGLEYTEISVPSIYPNTDLFGISSSGKVFFRIYGKGKERDLRNRLRDIGQSLY